MAIDRSMPKGELDVEELLDELTQKIERLRALYEQYFMGLERLEPQTPRREVTRKLQEMAQLHLRNTALRYRFNMLNQKFSVYTTYWNRTQRAIENGTYFRDVARVGRMAQNRGVDVPDEVLRALPPRMRDKFLKDRERLAQQARAGGGRAGRAAEAAAREADKAAANAAPPELSLDDLADATFDEHGDIDAALDNLFGEAESAVGQPVRVTSPPPARAAAPSGSGPRPAAPAPSRAAGTPPPTPAVPSPTRGAPPPTPVAPSTTRGAPPPTPAPSPARPRADATPRPSAAPAPAPAPAPPQAPAPPKPAATAGSPRPAPSAAATPPAVRPAPAAGPGTPPSGAPALPPGVDEQRAREIHKRYVQAKRLLGEDADNIKLEHVVATIAKQAPAIMKQHQASGVDFEVVIKDNKVILKATPKK
jgi:hypothetical protein